MRARSALLEALGGEEGCRRLFAAFYARVGKDPVLRPFFPGKSLRFFRDFARKKWPLRATRPRGFVPNSAVPHSANLRSSLSGPWGQNKKGQSLSPAHPLWSLATPALPHPPSQRYRIYHEILA